MYKSLRKGHVGRQSERVLKNGSGSQVEKETYSFVSGTGGSNATTTLIGSVTYYGSGSTGTSYSYTYDENGNLKTISKNGTLLHEYTYDSLNQLTTWYDATADATTIYSYYKGGNLAKIFSNGDFISFTYGGGDGIADRIVVYDGQLLSYDMIGNPLTYRDGMSFTWKNGRQLATFTQGQTSASYNYNESGIRTDKTVNGTTTTYQIDGTKIVSENRNGMVQEYFYDESGSVLGIVYNGSNYYFRKNFRNDVLAILNASGAVVVGYSYDPWGNILSVTGSMASTLGVDNPFRYRGYYYDAESGLYYLQTRYYDPATGRFINADGYTSTGQGLLGNDMYAYCLNNPVNMDDQSGDWPEWIKSAVKWVTNNIVKPVVKAVQKTFAKVDRTFSAGVNVSGTLGAWIFNVQAGVSIDTKGNIAIQVSGGGGITSGNPGISFTHYQSMSNAPNIEKLEDEYYQVGGSIAVPIEGVPLAAAGDIMFMPDKKSNTGYFGMTGNLGFGPPGKEMHIEWGNTTSVKGTQFNIFDMARNVYIKIMEW